MYHHGNSGQQFLIKGHFLMLAPVVDQCYEGANFFIVACDPVQGLHSSIRFLKFLSIDGPPSTEYALFPTPRKVLHNWGLLKQIIYFKQGMILYGQSEDNKLVHLNFM